MHLKGGYIYIMSNKNRTVLYIGVTSNLNKRIYEHKYESKGFVKRYNCYDLIYFECFSTIEEAIKREKQLKNWRRSWKDELIKSKNPSLKDLSGEIGEYR